jgi:hypothetical protein
MKSRFDDADYQLRWPRALFVAEAARLLNRRDQSGWNDACELLLEDAFVGGADGGPSVEIRELPNAAATWDTTRWTDPTRPSFSQEQQYLRMLMDSADLLREDASHRKPYWSERKSGKPAESVRFASVVRQFVEVVRDLGDRGYFEKRFGKDCVDDPSPVDASAVIEHEIGVPDLWPLSTRRLDDPDLFCDVVEVLHDLVARPVKRHLHSYAGCGWHHGDFSIEVGRAVYRWRINQLLARSDLGLRLAEDGDDTGRLVATSDEAREDLLHSVLDRHDAETGDEIRHAVALFRARGADRQQKRSAVVALAHVLEERRALIKERLLTKDEGALFQIANNFNVRHQNASQQKDYDTAFLDWIFWWYLATIELTDKISCRVQ